MSDELFRAEREALKAEIMREIQPHIDEIERLLAQLTPEEVERLFDENPELAKWWRE